MPYVFSGMVVWLGFLFADECVQRQQHLFQRSLDDDTNGGKAAIAWDGVFYWRIATYGYENIEASPRTVVFFPGYPYTGRVLSRLSGVSTAVALLALSNVCFFGAVVGVAVYMDVLGYSEKSIVGALWILCCFPLSFFFRCAYSESMFLMLAIWAVIFVMLHKNMLGALVAGLATSVRPVGIIFSLAIAQRLWRNGRDQNESRSRVVGQLTLTMSGFVFYVAWLYVWTGDGFAFASAQRSWIGNRQEGGWLVAGIDTVRMYSPNSTQYWRLGENVSHPVLSIQFLNPLILGCSGLLLIGGFRRRIISGRDLFVAMLLLAFPATTHGWKCGMLSHGRYCLVAWPLFMVMGVHLAARRDLGMAVLCASSVMMFMFASMHFAWYRVF